jgi:hypothetical protein
VFVECLGFVEDVFIVCLAAVSGMGAVPCTWAIFFVTGFNVFFVCGRSGGNVGSLWAGLIFTADLLVSARVGEVD